MTGTLASQYYYLLFVLCILYIILVHVSAALHVGARFSAGVVENACLGRTVLVCFGYKCFLNLRINNVFVWLVADDWC
jgi:hypothetical protein